MAQPRLGALTPTLELAFWVTIGGVASSVVAVQIASRLTRSPGGHVAPGPSAETSTSNVLRRFRRQGWRLLRNATITHGREIDHIAVGPAGVVVVETTWRRSLTMNELALAAKQVRRSREEVEAALAGDLGRIPVLPIVVTWGHEQPESVPALLDGVRVVRGEQLQAWLAGLPVGTITAAQIRRVTERLKDATVEHDLYDRREHHVPAGCVAPDGPRNARPAA